MDYLVFSYLYWAEPLREESRLLRKGISWNFWKRTGHFYRWKRTSGGSFLSYGPPSRPGAFCRPPENARERETGYVESAAAGYVSSGKRWWWVIKWRDKRLYAICVETKTFRFLLQNRREFAGTWFVSHRFRCVFSAWSFDSQLSKSIISFDVRHNLWVLKPELKLVCFY